MAQALAVSVAFSQGDQCLISSVLLHSSGFVAQLKISARLSLPQTISKKPPRKQPPFRGLAKFSSLTLSPQAT